MNTHNKLHAGLKALSLPARLIARVIRKVLPHNRKAGEIIVGIIIFFTASFIATHYPHDCLIPHFIWDGCAYFIHAVGATPAIESILVTLGDS